MTAETTWERWLAGEPARDKDERDRYREYDVCASDADRAYAAQIRIFSRRKAPVAA